MPRGLQPLHVYVAIVTAAGLPLLAALAAAGGPDLLARADAAYWLFAVLTLVGELWPIKVHRGDEGGEVTTSPTFACALLFSHGLVAAVLAQGLASAVADILHRKPPVRALFNVAQYTLALAGGGLLLNAFSVPALLVGDGPLDIGRLTPLLLSGLVYFALNNVLPGTAVALDQRASVRSTLLRDLGFHVSTTGVLLALSPVLVVVADRSLALIGLLLLTVFGLYRSARRSLEKEHEALHDLLTDLPNRRLFHERVTEALYDAKRNHEQVAVMLIDLDRFKEINDTLGHHVGDGVLQQMGPRLRLALRHCDTIARLGGDEFAVLLPSVGDAATAMQVAQRLLATLEPAIVVEGFPLDVAASIGVAVAPAHGENVNVLMQRADVAMYAAKKAHTGAELYSASRDQDGHGRISLLADLRRGIDHGELVVHYQPIADMKAGHIRAVEALVRWQHPVHGLIYPDAFIPLAEHTELIGPLTRTVLDMALRQVRQMHQAGFLVTVAVNLSVQNLYDVAFPREVEALLQKWRIAPTWLELEITENTVMADPTRARTVLAELSAMGVRLAIDDFGTGYSSLVHLKQLPVAQIKIDRSFVMNMTAGGDDGVIVRSIIELARNLGLGVVAEGVESEEVCGLLGELGCDRAQGYYLSRPLAPEVLLGWMETYATQVQLSTAAGGAPRPIPVGTAAVPGAAVTPLRRPRRVV